MTETIIPNCNNCGSQLKERKTKNNRTIWACPNWKPDGTGCMGTIYDPHQEDERKRIFPRVVIRYNVASRSEKGKFRTVEVYESGDIRCNCMANSMGRDCRHMKETIDYFSVLFDKIKKKHERTSNKGETLPQNEQGT